ETVGEDALRQGAHVLRRNEVTAKSQRARLKRRQKQNEGSGRGALEDARVAPRFRGDVHQAFANLLRNIDLVLDARARLEELGPTHARQLAPSTCAPFLVGSEHIEFRLARDVRHADLEEKAIELRTRKREGTGDVERVLRRDDEEKIIEPVGLIVDGR